MRYPHRDQQDRDRLPPPLGRPDFLAAPPAERVKCVLSALVILKNQVTLPDTRYPPLRPIPFDAPRRRGG